MISDLAVANGLLKKHDAESHIRRLQSETGTQKRAISKEEIEAMGIKVIYE